MKTVKIRMGSPSPKQKQFLKSTTRFVAFGGARGGGKSWVVRYKAVGMACRYAGIKILIVRRTYPELLNNHINPLKSCIQRELAAYNVQEKIFRFVNGSTISFGYCNHESDLQRYQGAEYDIIFLDEATQLTEKMFKDISVCCRGVNGFPKRVYCTCNPGGRGHGWVKRLFVERRFLDNENPVDYSFIQSLVYDNEILLEKDPDYLKTLEALPAAQRRAWLEGDWNIFEGQVFEEFRDNPEHYLDRRMTHVIEPFDIPAHWNIYRSYDFGYSKPFSMAWWAVDTDGVMYRILECYGCPDQDKEPNTGVKWTPQQQFEKFREIERQHPYLRNRNIQGVADPAIWKSESGESVAETAARKGIYFAKGDNSRIAGLMQMHYRLQFDENGYPMMYIFKNCRAFIRTLPLLCYSETTPEDIDTDQEDHVYDESRYMCMTRPIKARKPVKIEQLKDDPLNQRTEGGYYG